MPNFNTSYMIAAGMSALLCLGNMPAAHGEAAKEKDATVQKKVEETKKSESTAKPLEELTLNDIQDTGILVRNIQQGAINIYEEASRPILNLNSTADLPLFKTIPVKLPTSELMPARREWLVYYLTSVEPVVRSLGQEVTEIQGGLKELVIPGELDKTLTPLWDSWSADVKQLNKHLDELVPLFDDAPHNNEKIREVAVKLYDDSNRMETLRKTIFKALQQGQKAHPGSKIMISPDLK